MIVIKKYNLPSKTLALWRIRLIAFSVFFSLIVLMFCSISRYLYMVPIIVFVACMLGVLWYLPKYFESCKIALVKQSVIIERGVFIKTTHILPFNKLIYTQTLTSPVAKVFKLTAITLKAARTRIIVPEMENDKVLSFIEEITRGGSDV